MEVQRIAALAPIAIPHEALVDTTIAGYKIPKGTEVGFQKLMNSRILFPPSAKNTKDFALNKRLTLSTFAVNIISQILFLNINLMQFFMFRFGETFMEF